MLNCPTGLSDKLPTCPLGDLLKNISAVGDDLRFVPFGGVIGAPTIRVDGVMMGGR